MGLFSSLADLQGQARELSQGHDPAAQITDATSRMAAVQGALADLTRAATAARDGVAATAIVAAVRPTSAQINFDPIVELELTVFPEARTPYATTIRQPIAPIHLAQVVPGASVPILIDAEDPSSAWLNLGGAR